MDVLNEAIIKAAVIDRLLRHHIDDDAVLISEMVLSKGVRRADLAVANGYLQAFEIKSELDTLVRLDGQLEAYSAQFDKVTLVVAARFVDAVLSKYPKNVEVWEARNGDNGVQIKQRRRGECRPVKSVAALGGFLRKTDIVNFLRSEGRMASTEDSRIDLMTALECTNVSCLRRFVLLTIKKRYKALHSAFIARRNGVTLAGDLVALRRTESGVACTQVRPEFRSNKYEVESGYRTGRSVNIDRLRKRYGIVADDLPQTVLLRGAA
ncbi:sce7726 family protein [Paraburkholderia xenovorans]|uniref:sce7726 family protein n=1 Tax=Paraburkholderia xenovorans TaxID=36873 RepID=UPI0038B72E90